MKILYLVTKSETGGAQTHIYQLSKHFVEKGNEVAVMAHPGPSFASPSHKATDEQSKATESKDWLKEEVRKLGVKFYPNIYLRNSYNPFLGFKAMKEVKKAVLDFKPNIVSIHSTAAGFLGRLTIKNKIPTIFTAHGWAFTEGTPFLRKCLAILIEKIAGKFCSKIICVSDFDKNLALKYKITSKEKIITIHNGVEISINRTNQHRSAFIKIVFVGRLTQQKDPLLLLKSFNDLSSELKDKAQISIIGEGPKRKELEKFIKENKLEGRIKLFGSISREEVFETLKKSDIFVLISNWEGFPYTIIEAMSCGLAIIASDVGGIKEAINEDCGILVERGDKEETKKALEKLLENPSLTKAMGEKARERAKKEFSLEEMSKQTSRIYQSVLRKSN